MSEQKYASWNPWHGCTKYSEGCRYCYVYRQDEAYGSAVSSEQCRKTLNFDLPVKKKRDGTPKIAPGSIVMTCFTSDFLLKDADEWREACWEMIKYRDDCMFYFFTMDKLYITHFQAHQPKALHFFGGEALYW